MMAFSSQFVVSVIHNGKPLREFRGLNNGVENGPGTKVCKVPLGTRVCKVPFGAEYKIRLKNKNNCRAYAEITIDGTDVLCGMRMTFGPNETIDLERFVDDLDEGRRFKFISLKEGSGEIQDPDNDENGVIEVKFYKESVLPTTTTPYATGPAFTTSTGTRTAGTATLSGATLSGATFCTTSLSGAAINDSILGATVGATVEGHKSNQKFTHTLENFVTECVPTVIRIHLNAPSVSVRKVGVFIGGGQTPIKTFDTHNEAYLFLGDSDFGEAEVSIKRI